VCVCAYLCVWGSARVCLLLTRMTTQKFAHFQSCQFLGGPTRLTRKGHSVRRPRRKEWPNPGTDTQLQIGLHSRHVQMSCDRFSGNYSDGLRNQFAGGSMMMTLISPTVIICYNISFYAPYLWPKGDCPASVMSKTDFPLCIN